MDTVNQIEVKVKLLKDLKDRLLIEITTLTKEVDAVKNDSFGVVNRLKILATSQLTRGIGLENMLGSTYGRAKNREFHSAQEYIDHLHESIGEIKEYNSHIDQAVSNLEKCAHDLSYQISAAEAWMQKSDDLLS